MRFHLLAAAAMLAVAFDAPAVQAQTDPLATMRSLVSSIRGLGRSARPNPVASQNAPTALASAAQNGSSLPAGDAATNLSARPVVKQSPVTFDIGGVKLGMSQEEVLRVARSARLRLTEQPGLTNPTYEEMVAVEMRRLRGEAYATPRQTGRVSHLRLEDSQGSVWHVHFRPVRGGQAVSSIDYRTPPNGRSGRDFASAVIAKYGLPGLSDSITAGRETFFAKWCGTPGACSFAGDEPSNMEATLDMSGLRLWLMEGSRTSGAADRAMKAEAAAAVGRTAPRPSF